MLMTISWTVQAPVALDRSLIAVGCDADVTVDDASGRPTSRTVLERKQKWEARSGAPQFYSHLFAEILINFPARIMLSFYGDDEIGLLKLGD